MADAQSITALNIGSQKISIAQFSVQKGVLGLKAYNTTSILADPAAEASRASQVQLAIKELAKSLKVGSEKAAYSLSGQSVFIRFVKLPPLDSENVEELVRFEAQQNVPFPLDEVIWDWAEIPTSGIETEVVLVAIKSDSLNELNDIVSETGLGTRLVDSSPTALYNALRYSYPDLNQSTLLIDVGAKTTNLVFAEGEKFFTRSVNIGGAVLTTAIAKEYEIPFTEAEQMKVTSGLVTLQGGHAAQLDEQTAALGTVIRNSLNRLSAELTRTITLFRQQQGGSAPQRVILAGGSANLPYLKEFLEEKLKLPVEFFNPLQRVALGPKIDQAAIQGEAHTMGELVGLGLHAADQGLVKIDLVPDRVQAERDIDKRKPLLIGAAALFLGGIAAWAAMQSMAAAKAEDFLAGEVAAEQSKLRSPAGQMTKLLADENATVDLADAYIQAEAQRTAAVEIYNDIAKNMASPKLWISDIQLRTGFTTDPGKETKAIVSDSFTSQTYGQSSYEKKADQPLIADSVLIRGRWRDDSQQVYSALKRLREGSKLLTFEAAAPVVGRGKPGPAVQLSDTDVIKSLQNAADEGAFAAPFEVLIPLKKPVTL